LGQAKLKLMFASICKQASYGKKAKDPAFIPTSWLPRHKI
jgi:hypothetical protein